jgi:hypothetical protein
VLAAEEELVVFAGLVVLAADEVWLVADVELT